MQTHNDLSALIKNLEDELVNVELWLKLNKLTPNTKKCETIFFSNSVNLRFCEDKYVTFKGSKLRTKSHVKYLGIHFDSKLTWETQVKDCIHKINFKLSKIRPLAKYLSPADINMLIRAFVLPYIHYCSPIWSSAAPYLISKLQSTVNKSQFFCKNIENIEVKSRQDFDIAILTFKMLNGLSPDYISKNLQLASSIHSYNTRQASSRNIFHNTISNKLSCQSLNSMATRVWNNLPAELKLEKSLLLFETKYRKQFLN